MGSTVAIETRAFAFQCLPNLAQARPGKARGTFTVRGQQGASQRLSRAHEFWPMTVQADWNKSPSLSGDRPDFGGDMVTRKATTGHPSLPSLILSLWIDGASGTVSR